MRNVWLVVLLTPLCFFRVEGAATTGTCLCVFGSACVSATCAGCAMHADWADRNGRSDARDEMCRDFMENGEDSRFRPVPECCLCSLPGEPSCWFSGCWFKRDDSGQESCESCECGFETCLDVLLFGDKRQNDQRCRCLRGLCGAICCSCCKRQPDSEELLPTDFYSLACAAEQDLAAQPPSVVAAKR